MKIYRHLWEAFISVGNFVRAYKDARKGKGWQRSVSGFRDTWALKLYSIRKMVIDGKFHTSKYRSAIIYEPKKRTIYKLPFNPDRIVQHAIMNILAPILERKFIEDSYACVPGKGQVAASRRCMEAVRRNRYCLKCDVRHFYPSIDQNILSGMFHEIIKDERFLGVLDDVVYSFPGDKNAPIGNYVSQWCGNFYLTPLDNYVKRTLKIKDYIRYCDDFMLFCDDKAYLHECRKRIEEFIADELLLTFSRSDVFNVKQGVDFCGYRHFDNFVLLRKSTKQVQKKRISGLWKMIESGNYDRDSCRSSIDSMLGWMKHANSQNLKASMRIKELRELVA